MGIKRKSYRSNPDTENLGEDQSLMIHCIHFLSVIIVDWWESYSTFVDVNGGFSPRKVGTLLDFAYDPNKEKP